MSVPGTSDKLLPCEASGRLGACRDVRSCEHFRSVVPACVALVDPTPVLPGVEASSFHETSPLFCWVFHGRDCRVPALLLPCHHQCLRANAPRNRVSSGIEAQADKWSHPRKTLDAVHGPGSLSHREAPSLTTVRLVLPAWQCSRRRRAAFAVAVQSSRVCNCEQCCPFTCLGAHRGGLCPAVPQPVPASCPRFGGEKIRARHRGIIPKSSQLRTLPAATS